MKYAILILFLCPTVAWAGPRLSGTQTVDSNGTAERLTTTSAFCSTITVSADENNSGVVVVGDSTVDATQATRTGLQLFPGQTEYLMSNGGRMNIRDTWVDSVTDGDGVSWNCLN